GLAVDRDDVRILLAQRLYPACKAGFEQLLVDRIDHVVQCIVRRYPALKGQKAAQEVQTLLPPQPDLDKIFHSAQRRGQNQKQDLSKWIDHPPLLARILQRRKMIQ